MGLTLSWLQSILFGLVMGLTELMTVSSQAHRALLLKVFGLDGEGLLPGICIRLGIVAAVLVSRREQLRVMLRQRRLASNSRRRDHRNLQAILDLRLMTSAFFVGLIGFLVYPALAGQRGNLLWIALALVANGWLLYLPQRFPSGNKDARSMAPLDGILLGLAGAISVIPGISRIGAMTTVAALRGAERRQSYGWGVLLTIPWLVVYLGFDLATGLGAGFGAVTLATVVPSVLAGVFAFVGGLTAMGAMDFLAVKTGFSGFSFYCWGAALFSFILYLAV